MLKLQKTFPMLALAALMITLTQTPANASILEFCKNKCIKAHPHTDGYMTCLAEKKCSEEMGKDKECKHTCALKHPYPQYDKCKRQCLIEKALSKKRKSTKK